MENNEEVKVSVKLERHEWPDEINEKKKSKRQRRTSFIIVGLSFFLIGMVFSNTLLGGGISSGGSKYDLIEGIMTRDWYFGKDVEDIDTYIQDKGFYGLTSVDELDPHTTYMSKEEIAKYSSNLSGSYVGIGVQYYASENDSFIIQRVFPNSPAAKAGIEAGDIIVGVDNKSVVGLELNSLAELVLGEEGTKVLVTVSREGKDIDIEVERAKVLYSTFGEVISDDIGYIELDQFGESTAEEVYAYLEKFSKEQNKLIVDLRDNGGGYLDSVVDIVSYFVKKDEIVLITESKNNKQVVEKTNSDTQFEFDEIVILVNEFTASASEVFTAALVEHLDNVVVVGVQTYGKGTVQQTKMFEDQSALKYTTAEWLTPSGKKIHNEGITPDVVVELHSILSTSFSEYPEGVTFKIDSVSEVVSTFQNALDFLGYDVDRTDGYFDSSTESALNAFESDLGISETSEINQEVYEIIMQRVIKEWTANSNLYDKQLDKALEILGEK